MLVTGVREMYMESHSLQGIGRGRGLDSGMLGLSVMAFPRPAAVHARIALNPGVILNENYRDPGARQ